VTIAVSISFSTPPQLSAPNGQGELRNLAFSPAWWVREKDSAPENRGSKCELGTLEKGSPAGQVIFLRTFSQLRTI